MKALVISVIGKDRSGIVDELSSVIVRHQGNWLASSFTELAGQFAGILHIEVEPSQQDDLIGQLRDMQGLHIHVVEGESSQAAEPSIGLKITANDRTGIVQEVTQALNKLGISIASIDTEVNSAANWGGNLFQAQLLFTPPAGLEQAQIQEQLESLADDLMVDFIDI